MATYKSIFLKLALCLKHTQILFFPFIDINERPVYLKCYKRNKCTYIYIFIKLIQFTIITNRVHKIEWHVSSNRR